MTDEYIDGHRVSSPEEQADQDAQLARVTELAAEYVTQERSLVDGMERLVGRSTKHYHGDNDVTVNDHADGDIPHAHGRSGLSRPWSRLDKINDAIALFEWAASQEKEAAVVKEGKP